MDFLNGFELKAPDVEVEVEGEGIISLYDLLQIIVNFINKIIKFEF